MKSQGTFQPKFMFLLYFELRRCPSTLWLHWLHLYPKAMGFEREGGLQRLHPSKRPSLINWTILHAAILGRASIITAVIWTSVWGAGALAAGSVGGWYGHGSYHVIIKGATVCDGQCAPKFGSFLVRDRFIYHHAWWCFFNHPGLLWGESQPCLICPVVDSQGKLLLKLPVFQGSTWAGTTILRVLFWFQLAGLSMGDLAVNRPSTADGKSPAIYEKPQVGVY